MAAATDPRTTKSSSPPLQLQTPLMTSMLSMQHRSTSAAAAKNTALTKSDCSRTTKNTTNTTTTTTSSNRGCCSKRFSFEFKVPMVPIPEESKDLMAEQSDAVSSDMQELLKIAACLLLVGDTESSSQSPILNFTRTSSYSTTLDAKLITAALYPCTTVQVQERLDEAVRLGFMVRQQETASACNNDNPYHHQNDNDDEDYSATYSYTFLNIETHEAAYRLIPQDQRPQFHLNLGRRLARHLSQDDLLSNARAIDAIVRQYHAGRTLLLHENNANANHCGTNGNTRKEQQAIAALCHKAAQVAVSESNFRLASTYVDFGIALLLLSSTSMLTTGENKEISSPWRNDDCYDLTLSLYNAAAEVEYCLANFETMEEHIAQVLCEARTFGDTLVARATRICALGGRGRTVEAVKEGLLVLNRLGICFPRKATKLHVALEVVRTNKLLRGRTDEMISRIPLMMDQDMIAAMQMLNLIFPSVFKTDPYLAFLVSSRMVTLSLEHGLSAISSVGFSMFGTMYCSFTSNTDAGYRFGKLALILLDRFQAKEWLPRVYFSVYGNINRQRHRLQDLIDPLHEGYCVGMETGDIEFAMLNASLHVALMLFGGQPLEALEKQALVYIEAMETHKQLSALVKTQSVLQFVQNLMGKTEDPLHVGGDDFDEDIASPRANQLLLTWRFFQKMILRYIFADYEGAEREAIAFRSLRKYLHFKSSFGFISLVEGLTLLAVCNKRPRSIRRKHLSVVRGNIKQLKKEALLNPRDIVGKQFLLQAELAAANGKHDSAHQKYICAIAVANDNDIALDHAIACERYGRYLRSTSNTASANDYWRKATTSYGEWGAQCKVDQLEAEIAASSTGT